MLTEKKKWMERRSKTIGHMKFWLGEYINAVEQKDLTDELLEGDESPLSNWRKEIAQINTEITKNMMETEGRISKIIKNLC